MLDSLDIRSYFGVVATACEVAAGKPAPDIYLKVADGSGRDSRKNVWYLRMSRREFMAGKNARNDASCAVEDDSLSRISKEEKRNAG